MCLRGFDVFRDHTQTRALLDRCVIIEAILHRDRHAAFGNLQVNRAVQAFHAGFEQDVFARHAEIRRAVAHVGRHIRGAYDEHTQLRIVGRDDEFAAGFGGLQHFNARRAQHRHGFLENTSFGQRKREHI